MRTNTHIHFKNTVCWLPPLASLPPSCVFVLPFILYKRKTSTVQEKGQRVKASPLVYSSIRNTSMHRNNEDMRMCALWAREKRLAVQHSNVFNGHLGLMIQGGWNFILHVCTATSSFRHTGMTPITLILIPSVFEKFRRLTHFTGRSAP